MIIFFSTAKPPKWNGNNISPNNTFYLGVQKGPLPPHGTNLPRINNITFWPPSSPFLLQRDNPFGFLERCDPTKRTDDHGILFTDTCGEGNCICPYVLNIELNSVISPYTALPRQNDPSDMAPLCRFHQYHFYNSCPVLLPFFFYYVFLV